MDFQITTVDSTTGRVTLGIPRVPRVLTGIDKLAQVVTLQVLRNPGRDLLSPEQGAGFRAMIGQYNFVDPKEVQGVVVQKIKLMETQLIAAQLPGVGTPDERLKKLVLQDLAFDDVTRELLVRIRVINELDQETDLLV